MEESLGGQRAYLGKVASTRVTNLWIQLSVRGTCAERCLGKVASTRVTNLWIQLSVRGTCTERCLGKVARTRVTNLWIAHARSIDV
ncbi:MAG: hypothetical protein ACKOYQ_10660 [Actinomycetota bacterium]